MKLNGEHKADDRELLRQVFLGSESGKRALGMILFELGFMSPAETPATIATKNFATGLVKGLSHDDEDEAMGSIIEAIAGNWGMQPKPKQED
jgi:hypothetical protein